MGFNHNVKPPKTRPPARMPSARPLANPPPPRPSGVPVAAAFKAMLQMDDMRQLDNNLRGVMTINEHRAALGIAPLKEPKAVTVIVDRHDERLRGVGSRVTKCRWCTSPLSGRRCSSCGAPGAC